LKDKKKCGIITFHSVLNYGAALQAYALKKAMSTFCDSFIVRYENEQMMSKYSLSLPFPKNIKTLKEFLIKLITFPGRIRKKQGFKKFQEKYLYDTPEAKNADFYITGSDQVWNPLYSHFDTAYFLDFTESKKKNSYAASFGVEEVPEKDREKYIELLKDFNKLSVREEAGRKIIGDLLGRDAVVSIDPTLLIDKTVWAEEMKYRAPEKPYILVYSFLVSDKMAEFVNRLSKEKGLKIVVLAPAKKLLKKSKFNNAKYLTNLPPEGWVQYFKGAEYIITNSFHGTVFSINFNKKFFVELLPPPSKVNSRLTNVLELFGLTDRYINEEFNFGGEIDYEKVNEILKDERKKSIDYLESIAGDYNEQN